MNREQLTALQALQAQLDIELRQLCEEMHPLQLRVQNINDLYGAAANVRRNVVAAIQELEQTLNVEAQ